jgi:hypothetical protein
MAKKTNEIEDLTLEQAQAEEAQLSAEDLAQQAADKAAAIADAQAKLADAEEAFKEAKAKLKALRGRKPMGEVKRGPSGVGAYIKSLIGEGKTNEEIMAAVTENWPANFTNVGCINWYRNAIKKWGPEGKRPSGKTVVETFEDATTENADAA